MQELDYEVLEFLYRQGKELKVGEIAKSINYPHSTIGSCIKRLEETGNVKYEPYKNVKLTASGKELAIELIRHSQLFEVLLHETLHMDAEKAHEEAKKVNLLLSCETINKICEIFNHPVKCPCGEAILNSEKCFCPILKK